MNTATSLHLSPALAADLAARVIRVGDLVRCEDFLPRPEVGACFMEGVVEVCFDDGRIRVRVTREVFDGSEVAAHCRNPVFATDVNMGCWDWVGRIRKL